MRYTVTVAQRAFVYHEIEIEAEDEYAAQAAAQDLVDDIPITDALTVGGQWDYESEVLGLETAEVRQEEN